LDRLYSIQFLRFIAAMTVANFHFWLTWASVTHTERIFNSGAAGVDVFFIISGIVIGLCLTQNSLTEFVVRRLIRVVPLLLLGTLLYLWVRRSTGSPAYGGDRVELLHSLLLWPAATENWYPLYGASWTLQYEMFFYILSAIMIMLIPARGPTRVYAALALVIFLGSVHVSRSLIGGEGYFDSSLYLEFAAGLVLSFSAGIVKNFPKMIGFMALIGAIAAFALSDIFIAGQQERIIMYGAPAILVVIAFLNFEGFRLFENKYAQLLGDSSFVIYMTHLSTLQLVYYYGLVYEYTLAEHPLATITIMNGATVAVGVIGYLLIEKPLLKFLRGLLIRKRVSLAVGETAPAPAQ
jgi:exopolysaccharide production protein ExoZ